MVGAYCKGNYWYYYKIPENNKDYYYLKCDEQNKNHVFFYVDKDNIPRSLSSKSLLKPSEFTTTDPAFRANLEVYNKLGGFSSYQAEFPYRMSQVQGSMVSSGGNLVNIGNHNNVLFIRNIFKYPSDISFDLYIWDEDRIKPLDKKLIRTNRTNILNISDYLSVTKFGNLGFYADGYLCIPIFYHIQKMVKLVLSILILHTKI